MNATCPEKPRHGTKTTIAQTTPNFVDVLELPAETKKLGYTLENERLEPKHPPFEDVFPIENGDFPASHVSFQGCMID